MNRQSTSKSSLGSKTAARLLLTASVLAFAAPALAHETLFASDVSLGHAAESGERVTQQSGVTQIRLSGGGVASFVAGASFQIRSDGSVDLFAGTVTVAGTEGTPVVVHLADQGEGRVAGRGSAASFSVDVRERGRNEARGHVLTGMATITFGTGSPRQFNAGQMWHGAGEHVSLAVANGAAAVPAETAANASVEAMGPHGGERATPVAAANNGVPVVLGDALAAAGASGDIVAAARRVQAASANPSIETYPARDLALLVGYAARLNGAYGGVPFNGAAADIIRTYLQFLSGGGAQGNFLSAYASFMVQYLDLIRAGALPSSFKGTSLVQINSFIAFRGRTVGFGTLSGQNKVLIDAYLAFIQSGGNADQFLVRYTDLTAAYFSYIRGGGTPAGFTGASQTTITAYLTFLRDAGLLANLTAQNQALLTAYLNSLTANGAGLAFADQYRTSLNLYYVYLQQGRLPSGYTAADVAALRQYLETLKATGLFDSVLGTQASFFNGYLVYLQGGGAVDGYGQLPANVFTGYTTALTLYYDYLKQGGSPSAYTALTQAQISAYLTALQNAGASSRYLGNLTSFWADYFAWIDAGNNANLFAGLPVPPDYPAFTSALNAYYVYLSNGGLPSNYSALTQEQLRTYINALIAAGRLSDLGGNASFLSAYFTYLGNGGTPNGYAQLPVYISYQSALTAYYSYLQGGGLPNAYTALTPVQLQAYLQTLINAGVYSSLFSGQTATFLTSYYTFVSGGGSPNSYTGLPAYASYVSALNLYFVYLQGGGIPGNYTALTLAQLQAYLQAMTDAGILGQFFTGSTLTFFQGYYSYVSGGGTANSYSGLATIATGSGSGSGGSSGSATGLLTSYTGGFTTTTNVKIAAVLGSNNGGLFSGQTVALGADGGLSNSTAITPQTAKATDIGGDSRGIVGRLYNGTVLNNVSASVVTYGANNGLSYVLMAPIGTMPTTGTVSYSIASATHPVYDDGHTAPGTFAASLMIGLSNLNYAINGSITMPDATYSVTAGNIATGTLVAPQSASATFYDIRPAISAGPACPAGGCLLNMFGSFGGANPQERLGLAYHVIGSPAGKTITGAVLFGADGTIGSGAVVPVTTKTYTNQVFASVFNGNTIAYDSTPIVATPDGKLTSFVTSGGSLIQRGTNSDYDSGGIDGVIGWTRWANGTTQTPVGSSGNTFALTGGEASIWGTRATSVPTTGTVNYSVLGSTTPVYHVNATGTDTLGTFKSASLAVNFATLKLGVTGVVNGGGNDYTFATAGGTAAPSIALSSTAFTGTGTASVTGGALTSGAPGTGSLSAFLAGPSASNAGLTYKLNTTATGSEFVSGTIAFGSPVIAATATAAPTGAGLVLFSAGTTGDLQLAGTLTAQASGKLDADPLGFGRGSNTDVDFGTAGGVIGWTRWEGGTTTVGSSNAAAKTYAANGGISQVYGKLATNLPTTGTVNYTMIGSTRPTIPNGSIAPGSVTSAHLAVAFSTMKVGYDFAIDFNGANTSASSTGGVAAPSVTLGANGVFGDLTTSGSQALAVLGFLAGPGGNYAGLTYDFVTMQHVSGAIIFKGP